MNVLAIYLVNTFLYGLRNNSGFSSQVILMVQAPSKTMTLEAFLHLPETKPDSAYINERIVQKPMSK